MASARTRQTSRPINEYVDFIPAPERKESEAAQVLTFRLPGLF